ncbi:FAD-binding oxidoreductase [Truepera radiovictrix]|uniref:FAD linked oxidase domain protein n=1 Tax=Truepera radiovictrix (strain DSM 17093 / CIP 108686 / LMG 22925 / RQ-24) TaxID=649638 RepID=D7CUY2_TRURR|nr:FAD-binding oxidoreductase [Truepera radiovictrix]ADI15809.1 FAD linked oxidase domain protein [Truepera radiovictrix DSM 17093]WMT58563.1 FAD-binding oxidoreductase [Truepera radiovictrix]
MSGAESAYTSQYTSWGRYPRAQHRVRRLAWRHDAEAALTPGDGTVLPYAYGRSYGDVCLNDGGTLIDTRALNRLIAFDPQTGVLRAEAGVSLEQVLAFAVPRGFFLPVSPGTRYVSLAGAVANDVHGKNHHRAGTFGRHVRAFELLRSDSASGRAGCTRTRTDSASGRAGCTRTRTDSASGRAGCTRTRTDGARLVCSPEENPELFRATVGGLGLTGLMLWVEIALKPIRSAELEVETIKFANLDEFFELSAESDATHDYTVAWVDCAASGATLGRGLLMRGNEAADGPLTPHTTRRLNVPLEAPNALLNPLSIRAFNALYYHKRRAKVVRTRQHYSSFFYPLDALGGWNKLYGPRGLLQYQCVLPYAGDAGPLKMIFRAVADSGMGSPLAVLKVFGDLPSPGMLSFPRPGVTLALDFPNAGARTLALLARLDDIVRAEGGRLYPAKDARMSGRDFRRFYPQWRAFARFVDPRFSSSFWRRVTQDAAQETGGDGEDV